MSTTAEIDLGFLLSPIDAPVKEILKSIKNTISSLVVICHLVTETSPGEQQNINLKELIDENALADFVQKYDPLLEI